MVLAEEKEVVYAPEKCYFDGNWTKKQHSLHFSAY